jgi:hypothetical protein
MNLAPIAFLARSWRVELGQALALGSVFAYTRFAHERAGQLLPFAFALALCATFMSWIAPGQRRRRRWLWRLSRRVARFRSVSRDRVTLLYPVGLESEVELQEVLRWSLSDLDDLSRRFGAPAPRHVNIVLFASHQDLSADFEWPMGGTVVPHANAVLLAADCPLRDGLRHELTHLFAADWNIAPPPILQEGLAVWLEGTVKEVSTGEVSGRLLAFSGMDVAPMLDQSYFFSAANTHRCYVLAGGFTGFLIQRFGWARYRDYYRIADARTFRARFEGHFGMSLETAWQRWRDESIVMETLRQSLREDRLFRLHL